MPYRRWFDICVALDRFAFDPEVAPSAGIS